MIKGGQASNDAIKNLLSSFHAKHEQSRHSFQIRFYHRPMLCMHCRDYIWGEGHVGYTCLRCVQCVHASCRLFANFASECPGTAASRENMETVAATNIDEITRAHVYPVENWTTTIVKEWLAVVNLHRYAEVFYTYNINGAKLLALDMYQLSAFRIRDSYHHAAILQCRDELVHVSRHYANVNQMILEEEKVKGICAIFVKYLCLKIEAID
jgi:hypothetical protein